MHSVTTSQSTTYLVRICILYDVLSTIILRDHLPIAMAASNHLVLSLSAWQVSMDCADGVGKYILRSRSCRADRVESGGTIERLFMAKLYLYLVWSSLPHALPFPDISCLLSPGSRATFHDRPSHVRGAVGAGRGTSVAPPDAAPHRHR